MKYKKLAGFFTLLLMPVCRPNTQSRGASRQFKCNLITIIETGRAQYSFLNTHLSILNSKNARYRFLQSEFRRLQHLGYTTLSKLRSILPRLGKN